MSMNFAREQSLLRQRLQASGSPELAAARRQELGGEATFLGAPQEAVEAAARDLVAAYPQMGRAQMTAFVRTLWQSRIHELRAVGIELLAARATLLEPADFAFLEGLLKDCHVEPLAARLAGDVLGAVVVKNKKLWKDLKRFATASQDLLRRAAVRASRRPLLDDTESFPRFVDLVEPLFASPDAALQRAIDELLAAAAAVHRDAVAALVQRHGRQIELPPPPPPPAPVAPPPPAPATPTPVVVVPAAPPAPQPKRPAPKPAVARTPAPKKPVAKAPPKKPTKGTRAPKAAAKAPARADKAPAKGKAKPKTKPAGKRPAARKG